MRLFPIILLPGLAACDVAGPGFHGVPKAEISIDGSDFTVRRKGDVAEAIRTSPEMMPGFRPTASKAVRAVHQSTGCGVAWVVGDPAMMRLGLACDGRDPPKPPRDPKIITCDLFDDGFGGFEMECA